MSYRRHSVSKRARVAHKKREKQRKKKLGGLAAFGYSNSVGVGKKRLSARMGSVG